MSIRNGMSFLSKASWTASSGQAWLSIITQGTHHDAAKSISTGRSSFLARAIALSSSVNHLIWFSPITSTPAVSFATAMAVMTANASDHGEHA